MSDYTRLISYVYMYRNHEKGKNAGFVKLESRNGQCKIGISLKGLPPGTADLEVLLFSGNHEVSIGKIYIRNGQGELRVVTDQASLVGSGIPLSQVGGLKVQNENQPDIYYATIWDDGVMEEEAIDESECLKASEETSAAVTMAMPLEQKSAKDSEVMREEADEVEDIRVELLRKTVGGTDTQNLQTLVPGKSSQIVAEEVLEGQNCDECDPCDDCKGNSKEEASIEEMEDQYRMANFREGRIGESSGNIRRPLFGHHWEQGFSARNNMNRTGRRLQIPDTSAHTLRPFNNQSSQNEEEEEMEERVTSSIQTPITYTNSEDAALETAPKEHTIYEETILEDIIMEQSERRTVSPAAKKETENKAGTETRTEAEKTSAPDTSADLEPETHQEHVKPVPDSPWEAMMKRFPKMAPFSIDIEHEVLSIQPQDIGLLPRDTWIFGNNSFLLHGYYQYRYLVLVRLVDDREKFLLGVPGIYHNNERFMANMFGFTNFYLAESQSQEIGRFGFWCTEIKL